MIQRSKLPQDSITDLLWRHWAICLLGFVMLGLAFSYGGVYEKSGINGQSSLLVCAIAGSLLAIPVAIAFLVVFLPLHIVFRFCLACVICFTFYGVFLFGSHFWLSAHARYWAVWGAPVYPASVIAYAVPYLLVRVLGGWRLCSRFGLDEHPSFGISSMMIAVALAAISLKFMDVDLVHGGKGEFYIRLAVVICCAGVGFLTLVPLTYFVLRSQWPTLAAMLSTAVLSVLYLIAFKFLYDSDLEMSPYFESKGSIGATTQVTAAIGAVAIFLVAMRKSGWSLKIVGRDFESTVSSEFEKATMD